ncbi:hypothetical protein MKQ70_06125 [Chitinophaga sedimenti]|uniref:hypothetical protein n=1 Tax=Chitinophaga sedimenti TaxID=2033606 RepID=UPI0020036281|nr:hypothetical protein [Chitinophaga sedimenti]MCK7554604.1 hypothetical protein [Chitinophaga sedimenti]
MNADSLLMVSNGHITVYNKKTNRYTDLPYDAHTVYGMPFIPTAVELDNQGNAGLAAITVY